MFLCFLGGKNFIIKNSNSKQLIGDDMLVPKSKPNQKKHVQLWHPINPDFSEKENNYSVGDNGNKKDGHLF